MSDEDDKTIFEQQLNNLWNNKEDRIERAKHELLSNFTAQQNSLGTRLIGFIAGLFVLLQLSQTSNQYKLASVYPNFPEIIVADIPFLWDSLKVAFLFFGTWILLVLVLRSIFRYAVFGKLASYAMWVTSNEAKEIVRVRVKEYEMKPMAFEFREIWALSQATAKKVYKEKLYWIIPANWFLSFKFPNCPSCQKKGHYFSFAFSFILTLLLLLFLW
jgi:hypothetical protein